MIFIFVLLCCFSLSLAFRCQFDKELDNVTVTNFTIVRQKDLDDKWLWITNMNVFLFGRIENGADARIHAGFYDRNTGALIYKVIVSCKDNTWKTMYDKNGNGNNQKWKTGTLENGCPTGDFDIIANIGCPHWLTEDEIESMELKCAKQAYFLFNGQVLETDIIEDGRGRERTEELPVYIRKGRLFKAHIARSGAYFTKEAYGKCFAFPNKYYSDCLAANHWMKQRNDVSSGLDFLGAWSMGYTVECKSYDENDDDSKLFKSIQTKIVPDGSAISKGRSYKTCCCSYLDGYLDTATCKSNYGTTDCNNIEEDRCSEYESFIF